MTSENIFHQIGRFEGIEQAEMTGLTGWHDLVMRGYDFDGDQTFSNGQFNMEYCDSRIRGILALHENGKVIATLTLSRATIAPEIYNSISIHGIVCLPEYQGKGYGKVLYKELLKIPNLEIVEGTTKTPGLVAAAVSAARGTDFRTFFGNFEVTSETQAGTTLVHHGFLRDYFSRRVRPEVGNAVYFKSVDILRPYKPDVSKMPSQVQAAFEPIIKAQEEAGEEKTAVSLLLSIKNELLKND